MNRVKTSRAAYGALLASLVALAGGCGGGEERLAREEITERANEICRELDRKVAAAPTPRDLESMEAFADEAIPAYDDAIDELRDLQPPEDLQQRYDAWLASGEEARAILEDLREAAAARDAEEVQRVLGAPAERVSRRSNRLAASLGFRDCVED